MAKIQLFVCCHQPSFVPEHPLLAPIQVGAALAEERFPGFLHYRRYLYPEPEARLPYRLERSPAPEVLDRLGYGRFGELIGRYDVILP